MDEERIIELLPKLGWEGLIREIVREQGLDPWNLDIKKLVDRYMEIMKKAEELDLRIDGKFILVASILLAMKAENMFVKEEIDEVLLEILEETPKLEVRKPPARKRPISLNELIEALRKAMKVKEKRELKVVASRRFEYKVKKIDLGEKMRKLYRVIVNLIERLKAKEIRFSMLVPSRRKEDVIWTFVPLIHLANERKVGLRQEEHFGEIYVKKIG